jgi:endoglucanase
VRPFITFGLFLGLGIARLSAADTGFVPENPPEMRRLTAPDSPARRAARRFHHGVNLGNYLEVPPGQSWAVTCSADEFALMKHEGFDHVRVPIGWHHYTGPGPDFTLSSEIFARTDFVVNSALKTGLAVIINIHHFDALTTEPAGQTERFLAIWRQVAAHYASFPEQLAFELLNEPKDAATTLVMNPLYAAAIRVIRSTNPHRTIFVEPGHWGAIEELKHLVLPANDDNLIVSVHCYAPFYFTHQGATWAGPDTVVTGIVFPGPPTTPLRPGTNLPLKPHVQRWLDAYNLLPAAQNPSSSVAFASLLKLARQWSDYYGRPVHIGEFGAYRKADAESRAHFYEAFRRAAEAEGLGWAIWDWSAEFRYWDKKAAQPMPGMHDALFEN